VSEHDHRARWFFRVLEQRLKRTDWTKELANGSGRSH